MARALGVAEVAEPVGDARVHRDQRGQGGVPAPEPVDLAGGFVIGYVPAVEGQAVGLAFGGQVVEVYW